MLAETFSAAFRVWAILDQMLGAATPMARHDIAMLVAGVCLTAESFACCSSTFRTLALSAAFKDRLEVLICLFSQEGEPVLATAFTFAGRQTPRSFPQEASDPSHWLANHPPPSSLSLGICPIHLRYQFRLGGGGWDVVHEVGGGAITA